MLLVLLSLLLLLQGILNDFYNEVQQSTSIAPYMMSSGNHEVGNVMT